MGHRREPQGIPSAVELVSGLVPGELNYANTVEITHQIPGMRLAGVSGIYHPEGMQFMSAGEARSMQVGSFVCK